MQGKKIIISALIVIAGGFIGLLTGLFIKFEAEYRFKVDFNVQNQIPGVEIFLNGQSIGIIDSSGYKEFTQIVKQNSSLEFSAQKDGCVVYPQKKSFYVTNQSENNHIDFKVYPGRAPKLSAKIVDWRGEIVANAQLFINEKPLKIKSDQYGKAVIPLNGFMLGDSLKLDAKYGKMFVLKGNDDIIISEKQQKYTRKIVLFKRPENWIEFSITSNGRPVKKAHIFRDGKKINLTKQKNKYLDWLHDINKAYRYKISAIGYETKRVDITPTLKGRNEMNIALEKLEFNLRVKDKSGLNSNMEGVVIYNNRRREIARTNAMGMAVNLPFYSLTNKQTFYFEKKPDFRMQKIALEISKNKELKTVYINPISYKRYVSVVFENGEPATNTILTLKGIQGFIQEVKLNRKGIAVFSDPKIKPNADYTIVVKTEYGDKEVIDSPTEYELNKKMPKKIIFKRQGTLRVKLTGGTGTIEILNSNNKRVAKGVNSLQHTLTYDNYILKVAGSSSKQRRDISFFEENREIIIDLTDPCEKFMMKQKNSSSYLSTAKGRDELEEVYNHIDDKIENGEKNLTDCESQVIRMYADQNYNNKNYYVSIGAYKRLLENVNGADRKAVNVHRYGRSNLYYANSATIPNQEKAEYVDKALDSFKKAETKIVQSINKKFRRKFTTELYFDIAEALTDKYELARMEQEPTIDLYKKKAKNSWDSFQFQYSKCDEQLKSNLNNLKRISDIRLQELR